MSAPAASHGRALLFEMLDRELEVCECCDEVLSLAFPTVNYSHRVGPDPLTDRPARALLVAGYPACHVNTRFAP